MDPDIRSFAQVMAILVPSIGSLVAIAVISYRLVRAKPARPAPVIDDARLVRLEQAVDAIALEMERVGEGQRYLTQLMAQRVTPGSGTPDTQRGRVITPQ
jgi:predicted oxidoreductase